MLDRLTTINRERLSVFIALILISLGLLPLIDRHETRKKLPFKPGTRIQWYGPAALLVILVFLITMTVYVTYQRLK